MNFQHSPSFLRMAAALLLGGFLHSAISCGGSGGSGGAEQSSQAAVRDAVDACQLLTREEVSQAVGNPVQEGAKNVGSHLCNWSTDTLEAVSVVLTVWPAREPAMTSLCDSVRTEATPVAGFSGLGEAVKWSYRATPVMGSSADLEVCDAKAWIGLSLAGQKDEASLKEAARGLAEKVLERL